MQSGADIMLAEVVVPSARVGGKSAPGTNDFPPYLQGRRDASECYTAKGPNTGGFLGGVLLGPLIGLIPTAIVASTAPKSSIVTGLDLRAQSGDPAYAKGYEEQSAKIKRRRTWGGYAAGACMSAVVIGLLFVTIRNK